jgi:hypothetical protein
MGYMMSKDGYLSQRWSWITRHSETTPAENGIAVPKKRWIGLGMTRIFR